MRGQLIGVVNAKTSDEEVEGICFAIPANDARATFDDLVTYGYVQGRAHFDIELAEGSISSDIGGAAQTITYVTAVGNDVPEGTFMKYDRIYKINGATISSLADYNAALADISAGEEVTVEVFRGSVSQGIFGNSISFAEESTAFTVTAAQYGA